jgi:uncharacterized protein (TIGR00290 family)
MNKALMNWSGGKDSALALWRIRQTNQYDVQTLLTTVNEAYGRVSMHGVREELLDQQARRLGLPMTKLRLPEQSSMGDYQQRMADVLYPIISQGVTHSIFGDIFLEDLRQWREEQLAQVGLTGVFPLWKETSIDLLNEFWTAGFATIVVSVNAQKLDASFCGRVLDAAFVADLPPDVDPCGENGEFHTFVYGAPYFAEPIKFTVGETVTKEYQFETADGDRVVSAYYFTDLLVA